MTVALGAFHSSSQPSRTRGVNPVKHLIYAILLGMHARFHIACGGTVKTGGNLLIDGCIGEQVTSNLLDGKLVKGHILIDGIDHPVTKCPAVSELVRLKPVGISISRKIEPLSCPVLTITG